MMSNWLLWQHFSLLLIFACHFYLLIYDYPAEWLYQMNRQWMAIGNESGAHKSKRQTVPTVVSMRPDPRRALTDEMPRLRRLVTADRRPVAGPFHPGVARRLQIGTANRCSTHQQQHQSTVFVQPTPRFTDGVVYSADLYFHADSATAHV